VKPSQSTSLKTVLGKSAHHLGSSICSGQLGDWAERVNYELGPDVGWLGEGKIKIKDRDIYFFYHTCVNELKAVENKRVSTRE